jgi:uncharacterized damage-inducible protein DinB
MKDLFVALSRYNKKTNDIVFSYIRKMSQEQLGRQTNAYYETIPQIVLHVINSDVKWLTRLSNYRQTTFKKEALDGFTKDNKPDTGILFGRMEEFCGVRSTVNDEMIELINSIPENDFTREVEMDFGGKRIKKALWKLLLQWFNHHTHHRGQLSMIFDVLGIENDYSLVLDKIE